PVTQVTLNDALEFCRWKSEQMGCPVRLLTENEWEYVASNHGQRRDRDLPWTADECTRFCNVEETGLGETTPVNFFPEHELTGGVLDMFGNVYEWVQEGPAVQRTALSGKMQGVRGGSYLTLCSQVSSWRRLAFLPDYRTSFLGFRIACEIGSGKTAIS
ncbi:MAG: formylglycine-generating enzyme family protein, partial [Nitrospinaceae bacterium]